MIAAATIDRRPVSASKVLSQKNRFAALGAVSLERIRQLLPPATWVRAYRAMCLIVGPLILLFCASLIGWYFDLPDMFPAVADLLWTAVYGSIGMGPALFIVFAVVAYCADQGTTRTDVFEIVKIAFVFLAALSVLLYFGFL